MTLRQRLTVTLVATAVPLLATVGWLRGELHRRAAAEALRSDLLASAERVGRERCEADPAGIGAALHDAQPGHQGGARLPFPLPPSLEVFAYDRDCRSADPGAPVLPPALTEALVRGEQHASDADASWSGVANGLALAVRTGWDTGPCAVLVARLRLPSLSPRDRQLWWTTAALGATLLFAVWLAAGPIVRRIRHLTGEVRRSAGARYTLPVTVRGDDEIADVARAFNEASASLRDHITRLEERDRTLRAFLANTTHDVMIPLTVLQGHLAALRAGPGVGGRSEPAALVGAIEESHYIASLLHNLGAVARLESGDPVPVSHPVDLAALVERVVERHRPVAVPAGIAIEFGVPGAPVQVPGDVTLLEQAVSNIVHNAVRYNRSGGHVAVQLEREGGVAGSGSFTLTVVDDGPGVPEPALARLAERSFRVDEARGRRPEGRGLGLDIARAVADGHGFRLAFARAEAGGLEVTLAGPVLSAYPVGATAASGPDGRTR